MKIKLAATECAQREKSGNGITFIQVQMLKRQIAIEQMKNSNSIYLEDAFSLKSYILCPYPYVCTCFVLFFFFSW